MTTITQAQAGDIRTTSLEPTIFAQLQAYNRATSQAAGLHATELLPAHVQRPALHVPQYSKPITAVSDVVALCVFCDGHKAQGSTHAVVSCSVEAVQHIASTEFSTLYAYTTTPNGIIITL